MIRDKMKELEAKQEEVEEKQYLEEGIVMMTDSSNNTPVGLNNYDSLTTSTSCRLGRQTSMSSQHHDLTLDEHYHDSSSCQLLLDKKKSSSCSGSSSSKENMVLKLINNNHEQQNTPNNNIKKEKKRLSSGTQPLELELMTLALEETKKGRRSAEGSESENQPPSLNHSSCSSTAPVVEISQIKAGRIPISDTRKYASSQQRRFHQRFPQIEANEMLIDWFNCALIADILLQGYLYISDNYFAFYSNIFGYKTQIVIPVSDVVSVTKEKTAKIFPNAVGICTDESKYVFGSFISREAAFRLMQDVWRRTLSEVCVVISSKD